MFIKILVDRVEITISGFKNYQHKSPHKKKTNNFYFFLLQQLIKEIHTINTKK